MTYRDLPTLNAVLNSAAAVLLVLGYVFIRRRQIRAHFRTMWAALGVSAVFLASYLTYHTLRQMETGIGHTAFALEGPIRYVYYTILISHLILAFTIVPLALVSVYRGWRGWTRKDALTIARHRRIARWTLPIWLYVSITGVIVYLMLYRLPGASG